MHDGRPLGIKRVIVNLLENAGNYAHEPAIELRHEGRMLCIEVSDEGPGIPESAFEQVFDPFYRSGDSRTDTAEGLIALLRGRSFESRVGADTAQSAKAQGWWARVELNSTRREALTPYQPALLSRKPLP